MTTRKEIDAIFGAFKKADLWCSHEMRASKLAEYLRDEGFTITSVEPAMSDAELEREAVNGHRTPEALTPESVECALQTLCITSYSCNRDEHEETLRTHIAAQQAEVERLREALLNCYHHSLVLKEYADNARRGNSEIPYAIQNCIKAGEGAIKAISPEQKGGV